MMVLCPKCGLRYDDESRWTICPHNSLNVAHDRAYCRRHDLYEPCAACAATKETNGAEGVKQKES